MAREGYKRVNLGGRHHCKEIRKLNGKHVNDWASEDLQVTHLRLHDVKSTHFNEADKRRWLMIRRQFSAGTHCSRIW